MTVNKCMVIDKFIYKKYNTYKGLDIFCDKDKKWIIKSIKVRS